MFSFTKKLDFHNTNLKENEWMPHFLRSRPFTDFLKVCQVWSQSYRWRTLILGCLNLESLYYYKAELRIRMDPYGIGIQLSCWIRIQELELHCNFKENINPNIVKRIKTVPFSISFFHEKNTKLFTE
jgi:hypothetical protein